MKTVEQTLNVLPDIYSMDFKTWESLLMSCVKKNLITLTKPSVRTNEFSLQFAGIDSFVFYSPMLDEIETPSDALAKYPMAVIVGEFIHSLKNDSDITEYRQCYYALKDLLELNEGESRIDHCLDEHMVDRKGEHYHIDSDGEHYQTHHDTVKSIRDGSILENKEWLAQEHTDDDFKVDYDELCPHCGAESHGTFDTRLGLIDHCSNCGEPILICSMCDDRSYCDRCPEEHLKKMFFKKKPVAQKPNELYITLDGHSWMYFDTAADNLDDAKQEFYRSTTSIGLNTDNIVIRRAVLRRKSDNEEIDS